MKNKIITAAKYSVKISAFLVLLVLLNKGLAYLLVDDTEWHTRCTMHDFYELEEDVAVLFLGSSHSYHSIIPYEFEILSGNSCFHVATEAQRMDRNYALLIEYMKDHDTEIVYLEMYYQTMDTSCYAMRSVSDVGYLYRASDYMPMSLNKLNLLLNGSGPEYYINSFVPAKRYWKTLLQLDDLIQLYTKKQSNSYQNYEYQSGIWEYLGSGGYVRYDQLEEYVSVGSIDFSTYNPSEDWLDTFYEMYEYCQAHDIKLVLYSAAMPVETLAAGDYDIYINQVYSIIEGTDLTYIDFNLAKEELLATEPSDFSDNDHLNYYGAQKFTEAFYQVYYKLENPEDYFYDTYREKLEDLYPEYLNETQETA